jgi:hypothetical protein
MKPPADADPGEGGISPVGEAEEGDATSPDANEQ